MEDSRSLAINARQIQTTEEKPPRTWRWTQEAIAQAKAGVEKGATTREIAAELYDGEIGPTRNAVCGKLHRMKIKLLPKPYAAAQMRSRSNLPPIRRTPSKPQLPRPKQERRLTMVELIAIAEACPMPKHDGPVEYLKLEKHHCRAFTGERGGDWNLPLSCGRRKLPGIPYCAAHARLYYNPRHLETLQHGKASERTGSTGDHDASG